MVGGDMMAPWFRFFSKFSGRLTGWLRSNSESLERCSDGFCPFRPEGAVFFVKGHRRIAPGFSLGIRSTKMLVVPKGRWQRTFLTPPSLWDYEIITRISQANAWG